MCRFRFCAFITILTVAMAIVDTIRSRKVIDSRVEGRIVRVKK